MSSRLLLIPLLTLFSCVALARVEKGYNVSSVAAPQLQVDSIDYRADLTRVYGLISGRPHTSERIDSAEFNALPATDIDGVDFKRYFQFEDDSIIPLEIDFPKMKPQKSFTITFYTIHGLKTYPVTKH